MRWLVEHGDGIKSTVETLGVVAGLGFTTASYRADARARRVSNLMELAASHRELWLQLTEKPELARVLQAKLDLKNEPPSPAEERFIHLLITHLAVTFEAMKNKEVPGLSAMEDDVRDFLTLPIPALVWQWSRKFQQPDFIAFVENAIATTPSASA